MLFFDLRRKNNMGDFKKIEIELINIFVPYRIEKRVETLSTNGRNIIICIYTYSYIYI